MKSFLISLFFFAMTPIVYAEEAPILATVETVVRCPITVEETEAELQSNPESSIETLWKQFTAKGGVLIRMDNGVSPFQLLPGDVVFPSCSGGNNRSQTLWGLLRPYADRIILKQPHATQYGFDPYNGQPNWLRIKSANKNDEFYLWTGVEKSKKLGWDLFRDWILKAEATPEELQPMLEFYNREYYAYQVPAGTRRIYITFAKNAHVHLFRLNQTNESLANVIVLFYPLEDLIKHPLPEWNTFHGSVKSYSELAALIRRYLDLSKLR